MINQFKEQNSTNYDKVELQNKIRTRQEEGIMSITSWMLLRLEKTIKVPEARFNVVVRRHL